MLHQYDTKIKLEHKKCSLNIKSSNVLFAFVAIQAVITVMKQNAQSEGISHTDTDINLLMKDWFTQCLFLFKM